MLSRTWIWTVSFAAIALVPLMGCGGQSVNSPFPEDGSTPGFQKPKSLREDATLDAHGLVLLNSFQVLAEQLRLVTELPQRSGGCRQLRQAVTLPAEDQILAQLRLQYALNCRKGDGGVIEMTGEESLLLEKVRRVQVAGKTRFSFERAEVKMMDPLRINFGSRRQAFGVLAAPHLNLTAEANSPGTYNFQFRVPVQHVGNFRGGRSRRADWNVDLQGRVTFDSAQGTLQFSNVAANMTGDLSTTERSQTLFEERISLGLQAVEQPFALGHCSFPDATMAGAFQSSFWDGETLNVSFVLDRRGLVQVESRRTTELGSCELPIASYAITLGRAVEMLFSRR